MNASKDHSLRHEHQILMLGIVGIVFILFYWVEAKQPNILIFLPDELRYDWSQGPFLQTPNLDCLRKRGVTFSNAITPSPLCVPSRFSMASGKNYEYWNMANVGNDVNYPYQDIPTVFNRLREAGYYTMGVGKFDLGRVDNLKGIGWGSTMAESWGFDDLRNTAGKLFAPGLRPNSYNVYTDPYLKHLAAHNLDAVYQNDMQRRLSNHFLDTQPSELPHRHYFDTWVTDQAIEAYNQRDRKKPWFLIVNWQGPHFPMDVSSEMWDSVQNRTFPSPRGNTQYSAAQHQQIRANYAAMIENQDEQVGRMLEAIDQDLDDTLVIYTSDHGEMLGDKNLWKKSQPFQPSIGVPMVIAGPVVDTSMQGTTTSHPVSLIDVPSTLLDVGNIPIPISMEGKSLRGILQEPNEEYRVVKSSYSTWTALFDGRYKYVKGYKKTKWVKPLQDLTQELLYDLQSDPWEEVNLLQQRPIPEWVQGIIEQLETWQDSSLNNS